MSAELRGGEVVLVGPRTWQPPLAEVPLPRPDGVFRLEHVTGLSPGVPGETNLRLLLSASRAGAMPITWLSPAVPAINPAAPITATRGALEAGLLLSTAVLPLGEWFVPGGWSWGVLLISDNGDQPYTDVLSVWTWWPLVPPPA